MEKHKNEMNLMRGVFAGVIAGIVSLIYWYSALSGAPNSPFGVARLGNFKCYIVFVLLLVGIFLVAYFVLSVIKFNPPYGHRAVRAFILAAGIFFTGYILHLHLFGRWSFPNWFTVAAGILFLLTLFYAIKAEDRDSRVWQILIVFFGVLWGFSVATTNTFTATTMASSYNIYHSSAYIDSIFNVFNGKPFQGGYVDLYGHYALLFLPLRLFGVETTREIAVVLGILSGASFILCLSSFCMVVRTNAVRILAVISVGLYGNYAGLYSIYWQNYPHRILFPSIVIFMITYYCKKKTELTRKHYIIGTVVLSLAVLWNFETGLICSVAWLAFLLMTYYRERKFEGKSLIVILKYILLSVVLPFAAALLITNVYNVICGGRLFGFSQFAGLVNGDYMAKLSSPLQWKTDSIYLQQIFAFIVCFFWGILHNGVFGVEQTNAKANYAIANSIMGLGLTTYYVNRTDAGDMLVNLFFVSALCLMVSNVVEVIRNGASYRKAADMQKTRYCVKGILGVWAAALLFICLCSSSNFYQLVINKHDRGAYNYKEFQAFAEKIEKGVPEGVWTGGNGSTAICMELGWTNKDLEWDDVTTEDIQKHDEVLLYQTDWPKAPQGYVKVQEFAYNDAVFGYYKRQGN